MKVRGLTYLLFVLGFSYYCIVPAIALNIYPDSWAAEIAMRQYHNNYLLEFSYLALTYFISWSLGYFLSFKYNVIQPKKLVIENITSLKNFVILLYIVLSLFNVNVAEITSPSGYLDGYDTLHRGQLTTLYVTSVWWLIYFGPGIHSKIMLCILIITGLNLLSLGSRLGLISGIISMFFYYLYIKSLTHIEVNFYKRLKWFFILIIVGSLMAIVGVVREGNDVNFDAVISIFTAEPLFIYMSVLAYFSKNLLPIFSLPVDLYTSILGAIPSFLYPGKFDLYSSLNSIPDGSFSGMGGANHILILLANFGLVGFPVASFFEGMYFGVLVKNFNANAFMRALALTSIAVIPFILFREGLQTSIKLLVFNFLIFPFLLIQGFTLTRKLLHLAITKGSKR